MVRMLLLTETQTAWIFQRQTCFKWHRRPEPCSCGAVELASAFHMKVIILNWKLGQNDPFTHGNRKLAKQLVDSGKWPVQIEITENNWQQKILDERKNGIEFAVTYQGIGTGIMEPGGKESFWSHYRIPIVCIHGDHPAHNPRNHVLDHNYCTHLYVDDDFVPYSNKYFRKVRSAEKIDLPVLRAETPLDKISGKYFVLAKNITDPAVMEETWRSKCAKAYSDGMLAIAEELKSRLTRDKTYVNLHDVVDANIEGSKDLCGLLNPESFEAFNAIHSQLDFYSRNFKAVSLVKALKDVPIRIYGSGWESLKNEKNLNHEFRPGLNAAESQELYYSEYGILDVSPFKGLHDRSIRAMANKTPFLSNGCLNKDFPDGEKYEMLFYSLSGNDLQEKCRAVMDNPCEHRSLAVEFSRRFQEKYPGSDFVAAIARFASIH
jgi:hypothetical protein